MKGSLTDGELSKVCEVIATSMGLNFPGERWPMLSRNLAYAAREFGYNNINGFVQWLLSAPLNKEQLEILAAHLTISETYFWREPQVFTALTDFVLPDLIKSKKKKDRSIRIWSAGCSTGEEPYSLAIALHKTIPKIKECDITILATDINVKALAKASSGIYNQWSFRNCPSWLKSTYFLRTTDSKYEIIPEIKEMVTFACLSLVEMSAISNTNTMDIIFCRNVLMYFTYEWAGKISQNLFRSLSDEGWLVVSSCELSSQFFSELTPVNFPGAILYRKTRKKPASSYSEIPEPHTSTAFADSPFQSPQPFIHRSYSEGGFQPLQPFNFSTLQQTQSQLKTREDTLNENKISIRLLADQGHLSEALSLCNEAIASYKLSSGLYFLRASILQELDKSSEAIASLRKAIYINPDYIMGHFTLGNLFIRQGNAKNAKRYFNNVLDLLSRCANDDILPESEGLSVKYIREIIYANMQAHE